MIELLTLIVGFGFLFYYKHKVDKKIDLINDYRLKLYQDKYQSLLKKDKEYFMDIKELSRHVAHLEKELVKVTKNKEDKKNIYTLKTKK